MLGAIVNAYSVYEKISTWNNVTVLMHIGLNVPELSSFSRTNLEIVTTNYVQ